MHVLRVVRVLLAVVIVAALVGAASSVLSARPDLQKAKTNVDSSWSSLAGQLDHRYDLLAKVDDKLRPIPGPMRPLVSSVDGAISHWHDVRGHASVATQVGAANDLEAYARRLVATATASPRVHANAAVLSALARFLSDPSRNAATGFNTNVVNYEHQRRGPVRTVVASVLGDGEIPQLDTSTAPAVTAQTTSS